MASWEQYSLPSMLSFLNFEAPLGCYQSMNVTRALDYVRQFDAAERKHVFEVFGDSQMYLQELATHPDYQLKGAGTRLVQRGIEKGRSEGVNVTLIAQPAAEGFYFKKGFKEMRNISVDSVDGDQAFGYNVMAYDFGDNIA
ncbi:hypothetical protein E8E13_001121 [Curvularia kusanoi]|uniref:N-acetyltransferase domain-containing protein n=1 Tax=Curvularia kusanoi TaxID=90978 RepID=A0A9P4W2E4_CURKU|nr:hypothetical protein E8E13_001121 [Curvularia kusanoi]